MNVSQALHCLCIIFGNPPISFEEVTLESGRAFLPGGVTIQTECEKNGRAVMGIRPEAWNIGGNIPVMLREVEPRGQDQIVTFQLGDTRIRSILNADEHLALGQELQLSLNIRHCHFFDPETQQRL